MVGLPYLDDEPQAAPQQMTAAVGSDIMVATPTGQGLANAIQEADSHSSTIDQQDIALLQTRVESLVKQMMAQGAPDAEIQQAVAQLAPNMELAGVAQQIAQQQLDADKFNMFSNRNDDASQSASMGAGMGLGFGSQQGSGQQQGAGQGFFSLISAGSLAALTQLPQMVQNTVTGVGNFLMGNTEMDPENLSLAETGQLSPDTVGMGQDRGIGAGRLA